MYQKTEGFIPDGNNPNNKIDIKLRHKLSQITTIINSYIGDINEISWANLKPHHPQGVYHYLLTMSRTYESTERLNFSGSFPTTTATANPVLINADTGGSLTGLFSANLTVSGTVNKTIDLPNIFKITPEYKSTYYKFKKMWAYLSQQYPMERVYVSKLRSYRRNCPFSPEAGNHGAKYQWGAQTEETGRYISQADDQNNSGPFLVGIPPKPDDSWSDTSKTANDPCPSGYRVPTIAQWEAVIDNNPNIERVGSWATDGNYTSALYIRNSSNSYSNASCCWLSSHPRGYAFTIEVTAVTIGVLVELLLMHTSCTLIAVV